MSQPKSETFLLSKKDTDNRLRTLSTLERLSFGVAACATGWPAAVIGFYFTPFLLDTALVSAGYAGTIILVGRLWDAVTDPLVGGLTDRTRTRFGRRRPWLLAAAVPFGLAFFAIWQTPPFRSTGYQITYYALTYCLMQTLQTCYQVPYSALTLELSNDVHQRNKLVQYRMSFFVVALLLGAALTGVLQDTYEDSSEGYFVGAIVGVCFITIPILITVFMTKERDSDTFGEPARASNYFRNICKAFKLRACVILLLIDICCYTSLNLVQNNLVLYITHVSRLSSVSTLMLSLLLLSSFLCMPILTSCMKKYGKKTTYYVGISTLFPVYAGLFFLNPGNIAGVISLGIFAGVGTSVALLLPNVMLPDVVDEDTVKTGLYREGMLYAIFVFFQKVSTALSLALSNYVLEITGYINGAPAGTQPADVEMALRILCGPVPALIISLSFICMYFYPLTADIIDQNTLILAERREKISDSVQSGPMESVAGKI